MCNMPASKVGRNFKNNIKFTFKEAKKLADGNYSCVEEVFHKMPLVMSPKYMNNMREGLQEVLGAKLFAYDKELFGVPLAFDKIKVLSSEIIDDQDSFKLLISLSFIVFKPEPGKLLNAIVNKVTDHHFGCIIHGCINASIRQPNHDMLTEPQTEIVSKIDIGESIILKVWKLDIHHGILFVLGNIASQYYRRVRRNSRSVSECSANEDNDEKGEKSHHGNGRVNGSSKRKNECTLDGLVNLEKHTPKKSKKKGVIKEEPISPSRLQDYSPNLKTVHKIKEEILSDEDGSPNFQKAVSPRKTKKKVKLSDLLSKKET